MGNDAFALTTALIAALIAMLAMLASHYLPALLFGRHLQAPATYVWGCAFGILTPYAGWAAFYAANHPAGAALPVGITLGVLLIVTAGAGLGTVLGYALDCWNGYRAAQHMAARRHDA